MDTLTRLTPDGQDLEIWLSKYPQQDLVRAVDAFRHAKRWTDGRLNDAFLNVWTYSDKITW